MRSLILLNLIFTLFVNSGYSKEFEQKSLKDYIKFDEIQQNLRSFSSDRLALENVHFKHYTVLLSYPNFTNPNHARIYDQDGSKTFESKGISPALVPEEQSNPKGQIQWLAYSADGVVIGNPVYCHYGRPQDFELLEKNGVDLNGNIALIPLRRRVPWRHNSQCLFTWSRRNVAADGTAECKVFLLNINSA
ncbi:hypothetical protein M3Y97_00268700 [Aphelenchoides bicaudatus]|nr:hypothetical protein M3Y97_00268700 [Aphelenchoides bicaudatus]